MIRISPIRVIGPDNQQIGILDTADAQRMATEQGLDLVEIQPDVRPPICKIMDYGKYRYELSQKERKNRAATKQPELKEIRLGRSVKIDPHDVGIRIDQARRFLLDGHKVQITQRFRGREMQHRDLGLENLREFVDALSDIAKVEVDPRWVQRQASLILAPDRTKIEGVKRKEAAEEKAKAEAEQAEKERLQAIADEKREASDKRDKKKGPADERQVNPVDAELDELLGG
ncbi:MAG: translation initiation factor IF-3 [Phycisphaerales bacterium]|nr:MAG: translation initiation factor IF-3 [Phycisphaerales bacterium]